MADGAADVDDEAAAASSGSSGVAEADGADVAVSDGEEAAEGRPGVAAGAGAARTPSSDSGTGAGSSSSGSTSRSATAERERAAQARSESGITVSSAVITCERFTSRVTAVEPEAAMENATSQRTRAPARPAASAPSRRSTSRRAGRFTRSRIASPMAAPTYWPAATSRTRVAISAAHRHCGAVTNSATSGRA